MSGRFAAVGALVVGAGLVAAALVWLERPPSQPVEPVWDRQTCAHCQMHLSEPAFAAQAHLATGEVLFFDDPGCLLAWQEEGGIRAVRSYFHDTRSARWLAEREVGFVVSTAAPMGWGLAAVGAGEPGAMALDAARRHLVERRGGGDHASR